MALEHGHGRDEITARLDARNSSGQLRDAIFGGIDGTVTTFAIVAGVQGAGLPASIVIALGLANVLADGFSMAAGNYAGTKAIADDRHRLWEVEERHIRENPQGERDELEQILGRKGLTGQVLKDATTMKLLLSEGSLKLHQQEAQAQGVTLDDIVLRDTLFPADQRVFNKRNEKIDGDNASIEVENNLGTYDTIHLVLEDGIWKIDKKATSEQMINEVETPSVDFEDQIEQDRKKIEEGMDTQGSPAPDASPTESPSVSPSDSPTPTEPTSSPTPADADPTPSGDFQPTLNPAQ